MLDRSLGGLLPISVGEPRASCQARASTPTLGLPGWQETFALGINDAGQIVGWYYEAQDLQPGNNGHGFLATPVAEPATFPLLGIGQYRLGRMGVAAESSAGAAFLAKSLHCHLLPSLFSFFLNSAARSIDNNTSAVLFLARSNMQFRVRMLASRICTVSVSNHAFAALRVHGSGIMSLPAANAWHPASV